MRWGVVALCLVLTGCAKKHRAEVPEISAPPEIYGGPCALSTDPFVAGDNEKKAECQLKTEDERWTNVKMVRS